MLDPHDFLKIRIRDHFEASASGRFAIGAAIVALLVVVLGALAGQWLGAH